VELCPISRAISSTGMHVEDIRLTTVCLSSLGVHRPCMPARLQMMRNPRRTCARQQRRADRAGEHRRGLATARLRCGGPAAARPIASAAPRRTSPAAAASASTSVSSRHHPPARRATHRYETQSPVRRPGGHAPSAGHGPPPCGGRRAMTRRCSRTTWSPRPPSTAPGACARSSDARVLACAPGRDRTCDPLLRKHLSRVARHGRMPPYQPFTCGDDRQMSVNVADGRTVLAPQLARRTRHVDVANSLDQSSRE